MRTSAYDYLKRFGVDSSSASSIRALFFWVARPAASGGSISRNDSPQSRPSARRSMSCIATALQNVSTLIHLVFFICSNQNTLVTINPSLELIPKLPSCFMNSVAWLPAKRSHSSAKPESRDAQLMLSRTPAA